MPPFDGQAMSGRFKMATVLAATICALAAAHTEWAPRAAARRTASGSSGIVLQPPVTAHDMWLARQARMRRLAEN